MERNEKTKLKGEFETFVKYHKLDNKRTIELLSYLLTVYNYRYKNESESIDETLVNIKNNQDDQENSSEYLRSMLSFLISQVTNWIIDNPEILVNINKLIKETQLTHNNPNYTPCVDFSLHIEDIIDILKNGISNNDSQIGFYCGENKLELI